MSNTRPQRSPIGGPDASPEGDHIRDGDDEVRIGRRRHMRRTKAHRFRRVRKATVTVTEAGT